MSEGNVKDGGTERFAILLDLATQIAKTHEPNFLVIVRTHDKTWKIEINPLNDKHDYPIPITGGYETVEKALEAFVVNPQMHITRSKS